MRNTLIAMTIALMPVLDSAVADDSVDPMIRDESILRSSFEEPLEIELLRKGLAPRNAEIASEHLLDNLIKCWKSERNQSPGAEGQITVVRLGGKVIVTYASQCIDDLIKSAGDIPR